MFDPAPASLAPNTIIGTAAAGPAATPNALAPASRPISAAASAGSVRSAVTPNAPAPAVKMEPRE